MDSFLSVTYTFLQPSSKHCLKWHAGFNKASCSQAVTLILRHALYFSVSKTKCFLFCFLHLSISLVLYKIPWLMKYSMVKHYNGFYYSKTFVLCFYICEFHWYFRLFYKERIFVFVFKQLLSICEYTNTQVAVYMPVVRVSDILS